RLSAQLQIGFFPSDAKKSPQTLAREALSEAKQSLYDVLIVDTAGRLHVDSEMMNEAREIAQIVTPIETLFVVDSMAGQDAVNAARAFGEVLELTGAILTKADGDARGGVALSVRQITGKPILFLGVGEKTDALEVFHPQRIASRILGMGDVLSLVEDVTKKVDREQAERFAEKMKKGKEFDLNDLHEQLGQLQKLGGFGALLEKLPTQLTKQAQAAQPNEKEIVRQLAIIRSMTPRERMFPKIIDGSRKRRIAAGSGTQVAEINRLLKNFLQMQKMMKSFGKGGLMRMMQGMRGRMPGMF
ncbi:MAG TPA: signal recognition particle protein, partial [Steroidobacteraceae bacterium]|nr:signal recognition particle protein [Steroidobacteraceae bacterium]